MFKITLKTSVKGNRHELFSVFSPVLENTDLCFLFLIPHLLKHQIQRTQHGIVSDTHEGFYNRTFTAVLVNMSLPS